MNTKEGSFLWSEWDGNKWFMTDRFAEHPFQTELILADGGLININFVLACTALQSMIVFIGAISVLDVDRKRRIRALLFTIPIIHILNLFRNAGLVWMHLSYEGWEFLGLSMFEFGHLYASRASLSLPCLSWLLPCSSCYLNCIATFYGLWKPQVYARKRSELTLNPRGIRLVTMPQASTVCWELDVFSTVRIHHPHQTG